ncbi:alpha-glucosidase [Parasphingorhabdus sp. DH2-15]|uniref:alpha-glucosidase n=1 Tax=Parasphingorhabdus sp. DH2-15 TaxID=3444112 RepID=UPI003F68322F
MNQHISLEDTSKLTKSDIWWHGAAIYQIYPRSFQDSNSDGVGDLPGITRRMGYIASLGVDAIWISPFFTSPMKDFGYDVADYCDVDPIFGSLTDFDALIAEARRYGLKVLIDQVYSHTSDQHAWFAESRSSRDNAKADWFVWADAKPDGSPPSNWQSVFGGPAWTWDARRSQYYLHNFLSCQPQLNGHNPDVQDALLGVAQFWLDRGVDGFRLDALNFAMHDPQLRDNPAAPPSNKQRSRPFDFQKSIYNQSHPDIAGFVSRIRELTDRYDTIFTVAEVGGDEAETEMKVFTEGDQRLNSAYGFNFLYADHLTPQLVCSALAEWPDEPGTGWPSWAFENHDAPRAASRWWSEQDRMKASRLKAALLVCLRGNIIIYNGEELALTQVEIPFDMLHDPEARTNWPLTLSRDGARTPIPWASHERHCGFTDVEPWLPLGEDHPELAVDKQENDPQSFLHHMREMLGLRRSHSALRHGALSRSEANGNLLILERTMRDETILCVFNLGREAVCHGQSADIGEMILSVNGADVETLPPFGAGIFKK